MNMKNLKIHMLIYIIKNLIHESKCDLTPFSDSKELHLKILESFFQVFKDTELIYKDRCLIT